MADMRQVYLALCSPRLELPRGDKAVGVRSMEAQGVCPHLHAGTLATWVQVAHQTLCWQVVAMAQWVLSIADYLALR